MKIKEYFNRLPNYLSANFFALLGFTYFIYPLLGLLVTLFIGKLSTIDFISVMLYFLPIACLFAIIPLILLCIFLFLPKSRTKVPVYTILSIILMQYLTNSLYKTLDFTDGNGVGFALVSIVCAPLVILAIITYFILLILDLRHKSLIKNRELIENKYYKIYVNVFYHYFVLSLVISFFVIFYLFIFKLN